MESQNMFIYEYIQKIIILLLLMSLFFCFSCDKNSGNINYEENITKFSKKLKSDPNNCFYLDQIASSFQAINKFKEAIIYYTKAIKYCEDTELIHFQLGICYLFDKKYDMAVQHMDKSIEIAEKDGDTKTINALKKEKSDWLKKWEYIKENY